MRRTTIHYSPDLVAHTVVRTTKHQIETEETAGWQTIKPKDVFVINPDAERSDLEGRKANYNKMARECADWIDEIDAALAALGV
jgi:regulatory protein YycH of two-component signal transduction system YycFG